MITFYRRDDVSYLTVTHDFQNGILLSLSGRRNNLRNTLLNLPGENVESLRKEHGLRNDTKMLLICMWVTNEELRLIKMHPECISWDVTHQTNKQKRDLLVGCFKDGNNKAFHACHAWIINQRRWVFSIFFRDCVPRLWGRQIVARNFLAMTDGDEDEIVPLQEAINDGIWPNTVMGRCSWHMHSLGWKNKISGAKQENWNPTLKQIYNWICSWMNGEGMLSTELSPGTWSCILTNTFVGLCKCSRVKGGVLTI